MRNVRVLMIPDPVRLHDLEMRDTKAEMRIGPRMLPGGTPESQLPDVRPEIPDGQVA